MESRQNSAPPQQVVYTDFAPVHDVLQGEEADTISIHLPGFMKDQLRVHIHKDGKLIVSGQRRLIQNRWSRFSKEFQAPENCKADQITARFEDGVLYIVLPKLVRKAEPSATGGGGGARSAKEKDLEKVASGDRAGVGERRAAAPGRCGTARVETRKPELNSGERRAAAPGRGGTAWVERRKPELNSDFRLALSLAVVVVVSVGVGWFLHRWITSMQANDQSPAM